MKSTTPSKIIYENKTYRLSLHAIAAIEMLQNRLSKEAKVKLSLGKIIELAIFNAQGLSLIELLTPKSKN